MKLYHYTCLYHLPWILSGGVTKGEVPIRPDKALNAPNLTTNPNPAAQRWTLGSVFDKTKVRLTIDVPDDGKLRSWAEVCQEHRVPKWWQRALDGTGQRKFWYFYWGDLPPQLIQAVGIRDGYDYTFVAGNELAELVARVEDEGKHFEPDGDYVHIEFGHNHSWLLDGHLNLNLTAA